MRTLRLATLAGGDHGDGGGTGGGLPVRSGGDRMHKPQLRANSNRLDT